MSVNERLRDMVAASSSNVLDAIASVPDDNAFVNRVDATGNSSAGYSLLVAQDKVSLAVGLGASTVPVVPGSFNTKAEATSFIVAVEGILEDQILALNPHDYDKPPGALGYPIDCNLPTYYDCVVAHAERDNERADAIRAIFQSSAG